MYLAATGVRRLPRTAAAVVVGLGTVVALAGASPGIDSIESMPTEASFERITRDDPRVVPYEQHPASRIVDSDTRMLLATRQVPGFGGAYVDPGTGTLHVWLTQPSAQLGRDAHAALGRYLGPGAPTANNLVTHRADYSFAQLKAWKDAAMELFALPEVALLGISERTNRLRIGIHRSDRLSPALADRLAELRIPSEAVRIVSVDRPIVPELRDDHRPLTGGTQIQFQTGGGPIATATCSLGYPAVRNGVTGFVTAAHCSRDQGVVDDGRYWQATRPLTQTNQVGTETFDVPFFFGGPCPADFVCGFTDANFVRAHGGVTVSLGRIARVPCYDGLDWNGTDTWRVTDSFFTFVGNRIHRTGRTTGHQIGFVQEICEEFGVLGTNIALLCQDEALMLSNPGDSGAPVFEITHDPSTNDVRAVGIHWGGGVVDGQNVTAMSPAPFVNDIIDAQLCWPTFGC